VPSGAVSANESAISRASAPQIFGGIYLPNPEPRTLTSEPMLTLPKDADEERNCEYRENPSSPAPSR